MLSTQEKGIQDAKDAAKKPTLAVNNSARPIYFTCQSPFMQETRNYGLAFVKFLLWERHAIRDCIQFYTQKG